MKNIFILTCFFVLSSCADNYFNSGCDTGINTDQLYNNSDVIEDVESLEGVDSLEGVETSSEKPYEPLLFKIFIGGCDDSLETCELPQINNIVKVCGMVLFNHWFILSYENDIESNNISAIVEAKITYSIDGSKFLEYIAYLSPYAGSSGYAPVSGLYSIFEYIPYNKIEMLGFGIHEFEVKIEVEDRGVFVKSMPFFVSCCDSICLEWGIWEEVAVLPLEEYQDECIETPYSVLIKGFNIDDSPFFLAKFSCYTKDPSQSDSLTSKIIRLNENNGDFSIDKIINDLVSDSVISKMTYDFTMLNNKDILAFRLKQNESGFEKVYLLVTNEDGEEILIDIPAYYPLRIKGSDDGFIHVLQPYIYIKISPDYSEIEKETSISDEIDSCSFSFDEQVNIHAAFTSRDWDWKKYQSKYYNNLSGKLTYISPLPSTMLYNNPQYVYIPERNLIAYENGINHVFILGESIEIFKLAVSPDGTFIKFPERISNFYYDFKEIFNNKKPESPLCDPVCPNRFIAFPHNSELVYDQCGRHYIATNLRYLLTGVLPEKFDMFSAHGMRYFLTTNTTGEFRSELIKEFHKNPMKKSYSFLMANNFTPGVTVTKNSIYYSYYDPLTNSIVVLNKKCKKSL